MTKKYLRKILTSKKKKDQEMTFIISVLLHKWLSKCAIQNNETRKNDAIDCNNISRSHAMRSKKIFLFEIASTETTIMRQQSSNMLTEK